MAFSETQEKLLATSPNELIPIRISELIEKPENLRILRLPNYGDGIGMLVYESNSSKKLTDEKAWQDWLATIEQAKNEQRGEMIIVTPQRPPEVDRLHAKFKELIQSGELKFTDRILLTFRLSIVSDNPEVLYVGEYDGEKSSGIALDFYLNTLPELAKRVGIRFITGLNTVSNIGFFVGKIGRVRSSSIKPEWRKYFFPSVDADSTVHEYSTVQFLYPEDKEKYCF